MVSMNDWLVAALFGAIFGATGQLIRTIAGMKKASEGMAAAEGSGSGATYFDGSRLFMSIVIGAVAGVLAVLGLDITPDRVTSDKVLAVMASGYAGADFIEAFMRRQLPASGSSAPASVHPATPSATQGRAGELPPMREHDEAAG